LVQGTGGNGPENPLTLGARTSKRAKRNSSRVSRNRASATTVIHSDDVQNWPCRRKSPGQPADTQQSNHQSRLFESNFAVDAHFESMFSEIPQNLRMCRQPARALRATKPVVGRGWARRRALSARSSRSSTARSLGRPRLKVLTRALPICASRRSIFARVKFLSRLLTALNLLPSIATLTCVSKPSSRPRVTNRAPPGIQETSALSIDPALNEALHPPGYRVGNPNS